MCSPEKSTSIVVSSQSSHNYLSICTLISLWKIQINYKLYRPKSWLFETLIKFNFGFCIALDRLYHFITAVTDFFNINFFARAGVGGLWGGISKIKATSLWPYRKYLKYLPDHTLNLQNFDLKFRWTGYNFWLLEIITLYGFVMPI